MRPRGKRGIFFLLQLHFGVPNQLPNPAVSGPTTPTLLSSLPKNQLHFSLFSLGSARREPSRMPRTTHRLLALFGQEDPTAKKEHLACFQKGVESPWFKQSELSNVTPPSSSTMRVSKQQLMDPGMLGWPEPCYLYRFIKQNDFQGRPPEIWIQ